MNASVLDRDVGPECDKTSIISIPFSAAAPNFNCKVDITDCKVDITDSSIVAAVRRTFVSPTVVVAIGISLLPGKVVTPFVVRVMPYASAGIIASGVVAYGIAASG